MNKSIVTPMKDYRDPAYPTISEIGSVDLSRVPTRWQGLRSVAASIGAAAMTLKAISLEAAEAAKPVPSAPVAAVPKAEAVKEAVKRPVTDVCPLSPVAIGGEGRGAFGCIVSNPPVILSESEALDIIETEFRKRGIELLDGIELEGGKAPPRGEEIKKYLWTCKEFEASGKEYDYCATSRGAPLPLVNRNWRADLGTKDGKIVVEFVSSRDEDVWNKTRLKDPGWCSVSHCDVREAAERVVEGLSARIEGEPVTVGVFYDPVAFPVECKADGSIDWEAQRQKKWSRDEYQKHGAEMAAEQLKAQIECFFQYLAKKNASDAASH